MVLATRTTLLALVSALALAGCGGTGGNVAGDSAPRAGSSQTSTPSSTPSSTTSTASAPATPSPSAPAAPAPTGPGTKALFFGDSYFVGGAYTDADHSMAALAADQLGWSRKITGGGGTGFVAGNPDYDLKNFIGQIRGGALDVGPVDWLVIEGGGNDKTEDPGLIERRAVEVLDEAEHEHPEAHVVLVGTLDPTVDSFADTDGVIGALGAAAKQVGVPYINAQRWLAGHPELIGPDYDHPLPAGHVLLGRKLAAALLDVAASP